MFIITSGTTIQKKVVTTTLDELFKFISLRLTGKHGVKTFIKAINNFQGGHSVNTQDVLLVKNKYEQFGLISSSPDNNNEIIELTKLGRKIMNELNV